MVCVLLLLLILLHDVSCIGIVAEQNLNKELHVQIQNGIIQGKKETSIFGKTYFSYVGVPYAKPPINDLRFRAPQAAENWSGVLDATVETPFCAGINISTISQLDLKHAGSEDCLYLNIYTGQNPKKDTFKGALSVLVYFYGGAFFGSGPKKASFGPDYFIDNDVILVTPQYRASIFGYLSTNDLECPGNWGIKDKLAALQWVQKNIRQFGGDPSRVTIAGQSAGAVDVNYLLLSRKAKGLFHRVIMMSGSSLNFWSYQINPRKVAFDVGIAVGIETNSTKELVEKLKKVDSTTLMQAQVPVVVANILTAFTNGLPFTPTVEPAHNEAILTDFAYNGLEQGYFNKVPVMTGVTSLEVLVYKKVIDVTRPLLPLFDLSPGLFVRFTQNNRNRTIGGKKIKEYFLGNKNFGDASELELMTLLSDDIYWRSIRKVAEFVSRCSPTYFYKFSYEGELGLKITSKFNGLSNRFIRGVGHTEDTFYLFHNEKYDRNDNDLQMSKKLTRLFSNFVKTGNPTPAKESLLDNVTWPKVMDQRFPYLEIDSTLNVMTENFNEINYRYWTQIYDTYAQKPYKVY